jgi:hypothetical protein
MVSNQITWTSALGAAPSLRAPMAAFGYGADPRPQHVAATQMTKRTDVFVAMTTGARPGSPPRGRPV